MAYININSKPTISSACDLFSVPAINRSAEEGYFQEIRPVTALDSGSQAPIEFNIPATEKEYTDLSQTRLRVRGKILLEDGSELPENCQVAPVNNWLHTLFSQVSIDLNSKCVTPASGLYPYRALVENMLNYGKDAKESHLQSSLFYKDTPGHMGAVIGNSGYQARKALNRDEIEMEGPIHSDIFNMNKYMLNGVQILIKLYRSSPEFALMTIPEDNARYKIKITSAILITRKIKINPTVLAAHSLTLSKFTAKYPITRTELRHVTIPQGVQSTVLDSLTFGQLPQRVIITMVEAESFNGTLKTNPFEMKHFDYNFMNVACDGSLHTTPLKPQFDRKQYMDAYNTLFYATGAGYSDSGPDISYKCFASGYNYNIFDLTPDLSASAPHFNVPRSGNLRVEIQFAKALTKPIVAITFLEFTNLIEIDNHREVFTDYST